nr:ASKHA domain-containing protein [Anaerosolibacter carboniphilus]
MIEVPGGTTVMKAISEAGIDFDFPCGGGRRCGKCRFRILEGAIQSDHMEREFLSEKEINEGIHLACFTEIYSDISVELLRVNDVKHQILMAAEERSMRIEPHITKRYIEVKKPSLGDHQSDWRRLRESLFQGEHAAALDVQIPVLNQIPETLRTAQYHITAITYGRQILGIEQQDTTKTLIGMAFDIGTTTIVGFLIDLYSGKELSVVSTLNPQAKFGADVISRISYTEQEKNGLETLHFEVIKGINRLIKEAAEKADINVEDIYVVTIAGNTCMHHLFLGLNPRYISKSPYIPTISDPLVLNAESLHITINKTGKILVLPNIAGFVGADTVAVLLATEMDRSEEIKLVVDIGTNGEIVLGSKHKLFTCSCAAGPAFEGAQISSGMRGAIGAIDHVVFGEELEYTVIGQVKPQGICGSGLLDAIAGLSEMGIINEKGKFLHPDKITNAKAEVFKSHIIQYEGTYAFLLADEEITAHGRPILITQQDIREFQLAKGAMAAGINILMEKYGISVEEIKEVLLAGAFGNYMNPHSACSLGLIPKELEGKIKNVGNAAGTGAKLALLSASEYGRTANIADAVEFVELGSYPKFSTIFARSMNFK